MPWSVQPLQISFLKGYGAETTEAIYSQILKILLALVHSIHANIRFPVETFVYQHCKSCHSLVCFLFYIDCVDAATPPKQTVIIYYLRFPPCVCVCVCLKVKSLCILEVPCCFDPSYLDLVFFVMYFRSK